MRFGATFCSAGRGDTALPFSGARSQISSWNTPCSWRSPGASSFGGKKKNRPREGPTVLPPGGARPAPEFRPQYARSICATGSAKRYKHEACQLLPHGFFPNAALAAVRGAPCTDQSVHRCPRVKSGIGTHHHPHAPSSWGRRSRRGERAWMGAL